LFLFLFSLINASLEELDDSNEKQNNPISNSNANSNQDEDCDSLEKNQEKKKLTDRFSSIKNLFKKKDTMKKPTNKNLKINFNKYLVNSESFANNIKDHEEENHFIDQRSILYSPLINNFFIKRLNEVGKGISSEIRVYSQLPFFDK